MICRIRILSVMLLMSGVIWAHQIKVPESVSSIQRAVDQASEGDTVLVSPGHYVENIHISGKSIVLASHYIFDQNPESILQTILDGSQPAHADSGSVITISDQSSARVLGFTLTEGTGAVWEDWELGHLYREGGGVFVVDANPVIEHNYIHHNVAIDTDGMMSAGGGGIACEYAEAQISNNVIKYNQARYGAGVVVSYSDAAIYNNIIALNVGGQDFGGAGLWFYKVVNVNLINNTIVANQAVHEGANLGYGAGTGGAFLIWSGYYTIMNNIIWDNTQTLGLFPVEMIVSADAGFSYNNIQDNYALDPKNRNISIDPQFADSTYMLASESPCIDAGHAGEIYQDPEGTGEVEYPSQGTRVNDLGAYGGPDRSTLLGVPETTSHVASFPLLSDFVLYPNYPNPFNPVTEIPFEISKTSLVQLNVYDIRGRLVATLIHGVLKSGTHCAVFSASGLASGLYIAHLNVDGEIKQQQMLLIQ